MRRVGLLVLVVLGVAACSSSAKSSPTTTTTTHTPGGEVTTTPSSAPVVQSPEALRSVVISSCAPNAKHDVEISGTVTNSTTTRADYSVQIVIRDKAGKRQYVTAASASNVEPKHSGHWVAATTAPFVPGMTCAATGVSTQPSR